VVRHPIGVRFDEGRPPAAPGPVGGFLHRRITRQDIVPVHLDARKTIGPGLLRERRRGGLAPPGHGDGPLVVDADEDVRRLEDAGEVQAFVKIAFRSRAVAQGREDDEVPLAQADGQPGPRGMNDLGAYRDGDRERVDAVGNPHPVLVPHPVKEVEVEREAAADEDSQVAEVGEEPVVRGHGRRGAGLDALVAPARGIRAQAALALEGERLEVGGPGEDHVRVDPAQLAVREAGVQVRADAASFVQDLQPLALLRIEPFDHGFPLRPGVRRPVSQARPPPTLRKRDVIEPSKPSALRTPSRRR